MGNQQLLLIAIGVVVVGIMFAVGMTWMNDQATATNRDEIVDELVHYASIARAYYHRPQIFGGGGNSFRGLTMARLTSRAKNESGTYTLTPDPAGSGINHVTLTAIGTELGVDRTNKVKVVMFVYADSAVVDVNQLN